MGYPSAVMHLLEQELQTTLKVQTHRAIRGPPGTNSDATRAIEAVFRVCSPTLCWHIGQR